MGEWAGRRAYESETAQRLLAQWRTGNGDRRERRLTSRLFINRPLFSADSIWFLMKIISFRVQEDLGIYLVCIFVFVFLYHFILWMVECGDRAILFLEWILFLEILVDFLKSALGNTLWVVWKGQNLKYVRCLF